MNRAVQNHASLTSPTRGGIGWRLVCAGYLAAVAFCSGLAFVGLCRGELGCVGAAVGLGLVAAGLRSVLRRWPVLAESESAKPEVWMSYETAAAGDGLDGASAVEKAEDLAGLLREWSELERARGTRRFDPWAWQSLRSEIRARLRDDADVRRLFGPGG